MNQAQRIVLVIAIGLALVIVTITANLLADDPFPGGWIDIAPNTGATVSDGYVVVVEDSVIVRRGLVWLGGVALWSGLALWILRPPRD